MKYEHLFVGALVAALMGSQGTTAHAEDAREKTEASGGQRDETRLRGKAKKETRTRPKKKQSADASRKAAWPSDAGGEATSERKTVDRETKPAQVTPLEATGSGRMDAAVARAAGEAARREQRSPHEVSAWLHPRAPGSVVRAEKQTVLKLVDNTYAPAQEGELELGAHTRKPVVVPAYYVGSRTKDNALDETPEERALRERVQAQLMENAELSRSARLIQVRVKGQVVTLGGQVATTYEKYRVARAARAVPEVTKVRNRIRARNTLSKQPEWKE